MKRVATPRVIQMEAVECGVASLSIILRYYGRYVPLEELRIQCGVSRNGSNANNILKAARKYGLTGAGYRKSVDELRDIQVPAILFWGFNHFLVLEGIKKDKVYLNDPATGPRTISIEEFADLYTEIVLVFEKSAEFKKGGKPKSVFKEIGSRLKGSSYPLFYTFLTGLCLILPGLAMPAFLMFFIDVFFSKNFVPWPGFFLLAVFFTALFSGAMNWLRYFFLNRLNAKLSLYSISDFLWHLLRLPISFYQQRYYGEVAYRAMLNESVVQSLTSSFLGAAIDLLLIIFYGIAMFTYDSIIAGVGLFIGILNLFAMFLIFRSRANAYACLEQDLGAASGVSIGGLVLIESIKSRATESDFFSNWAGHYARVINARQEIGKKDIILTTGPLFFQLLASAVLLGLGSLRVMNGDFTVGMLMSLQVLQSNFLLPINRFVGFSELIQNMRIDIERIDDVLKNPIDPSYSIETPSHAEQLAGKLEFRNITFGYAPLDPPLIEGLSFTIEPGKRIAFVGPTGSGKSTIANLASGLLHPWSGEVFYDGIPVQKISRELISNSIATVDQSIFLFEGSVRENLTLWNNRVPDEMLVAACRDACIHEEIIGRPGGYDSLLIEGGRNLSGGQRQRLEIARALLYNPVFLILDEATSALDSKTERTISDRIKQRGCSALMIAHRLSTIQDCDEIIVLDRGKVVQRGTHEELKAIPGIYQELVLSEVPDEA